MTFLDRAELHLHYDVEGDGFPILLLAPGGMRSANDLWSNQDWNPRERLVGDYTLIGMDQRNAGASTAPVSADDGWASYTADQLLLLDHLGIDRCHIIGMCIGGPFLAGLLLAAPDRFCSAVALQPVGLENNREALLEMFDQWRAGIEPEHPEADDAAWQAFRQAMWGGDFIFSCAESALTAIETPVLVCMGDDLYHPQAISHRFVEATPNATLIERWKDDEVLEETDATIREFLADHTPT